MLEKLNFEGNACWVYKSLCICVCLCVYNGYFLSDNDDDDDVDDDVYDAYEDDNKNNDNKDKMVKDN